MKRTPNYGLPIVENNDRYSKEEQNNAMNIIDTELGSMSEAFRDTLNDINNTFEEVKEFEGKIQADYDSLKKVIISENISVDLQNQIDTVNTFLENKTNIVHIEEFEGVDDTEKINNAIKSLNGGGIIQLKARKYIFDNIVIPENVSIIGTANTLITPKQYSQNPILHFIGSNHTLRDINYDDVGINCKGITFGDFGSYTGSGKISNIIIENINYKISVKQNSAICVGHCNNVIISKNNIINTSIATTSDCYSQGICVHSDSPNTCENVVISDNYVQGFYAGIILWGTGIRKQILINKNIIEDCCHVGIDGYHAGQMTITNNIINRCHIGIFGDTVSVDGNNGRGNIITNNQIHKSDFVGIYFEEFSNGVISNNTVQDSEYGLYGGAGLKHTLIANNTSSFNRCGIYISNEHVPTPMKDYYNQDCVIKNNLVSYNQEEGIKLLGLMGGCVIDNNDILSNNISNGSFYGLYIGDDTFQSTVKNSQVITISNNNILNKGLSINGTLGNQNKGLYVKCAYSFIKNNFLSCKEDMINSYYSKPVILSNIFDGGGSFNINGSDHTSKGNIGLADYNIQFVSDEHNSIKN